MSYVKDTLATGEDIIQTARFNWTYYAPSYLWSALGLAPILYAAYRQTEGTLPGDPMWVFGLSAVPAFLGLCLVIGLLIEVKTTEIAVTSSRFVYKTGLISRTTKEVSLNKIEEIRLSQSIFGRLFGFGSLTLHGTGVGKIDLPDIDNPVEFRRAIETSKARMRQAPDDRDYPQAPVLGPSSAATIETDAAPHSPAVRRVTPADHGEKGNRKRRFLQKKRTRTLPKAPDLPEKLR